MRKPKWCYFLAILPILIACNLHAASLSWLKAEGTQIVDEEHRPVILKGVNLGGWLTEEMWMMPIQTGGMIKDHVSLWKTLRGRFSDREVNQLKDALRSSWVTQEDFAQIAKDGFNVVRIPILYDILEADNGYIWLDRAIRWARNNGLYVVIDLHGVPGRQSREHHTGESDVNSFFKDCVYLQQTIRLWQTIAARYKDYPEVAGYDLINEPMGADSVDQLMCVQNILYHAIREVDEKHIIIFEDGYKGITNILHPVLRCWENVVLSTHNYGFDAKAPEDHIEGLKALLEEVRVFQAVVPIPYFLGEFNLEPNGTIEAMKAYMQLLKDTGYGWAIWTYKTISLQGSGLYSLWGMYRNVNSFVSIDPLNDTFEILLFKINLLLTTNLQRFGSLIASLG